MIEWKCSFSELWKSNFPKLVLIPMFVSIYVIEDRGQSRTHFKYWTSLQLHRSFCTKYELQSVGGGSRDNNYYYVFAENIVSDSKLLYRGHSWRVRLAKPDTLTPLGHLVSPLVCRGPWMSTVVLYCWCQWQCISSFVLNV